MFDKEKLQKEGEELKAKREASGVLMDMLTEMLPEGDRKDELRLMKFERSLVDKMHLVLEELIVKSKDSPETKRIRDDALLMFASITERLDGFIQANFNPQNTQKNNL